MSHPSPLTPALERAHSLVAAGDPAGAAEVLERAIEIGQATLSQDDPDVLATQRELASVRRQAGDAAAARRVLQAAYQAGRFGLGDDDPLMLQISYDLGVVAEELGEREEARAAFGRVADFGPMMLGAGHWAVTRAQAYLGQDSDPAVRAEPGPQAPRSAPAMPDLPPDNHPTVLWPALPQPREPDFRPQGNPWSGEPRRPPAPPPVPEPRQPESDAQPTPPPNPGQRRAEPDAQPTPPPIPGPRRGEPDAQPAPPRPFGLLPPPSALKLPSREPANPLPTGPFPSPPSRPGNQPEGELGTRPETGTRRDVTDAEPERETKDTFPPESPWGPAPRITREPAENPFQQLKPGVFGTPGAEAARPLYHGANDAVVVQRPDPVVMPLRRTEPGTAPEVIPGEQPPAHLDPPVRPAATPRPESVTPPLADEATTTLPTVDREAPAEPKPFTPWSDFNSWPEEPEPLPDPRPQLDRWTRPEPEQRRQPRLRQQPSPEPPPHPAPEPLAPVRSASRAAPYQPTAQPGVYHQPTVHQGVYHQGTDGTWQGGPGPAADPLPDPIPTSAADRSYKGNKKRGMALFAVIAATLAAIVAVAALVFSLAQGSRKGDEGDDPPGAPTLAGSPPGDVKLSDLGSKIDVTWTDPSGSTVSFMVTMAHPGEQLKPVSTVGPGQTSRRIEGLSPALDYCFAVVAVYATDKFATSPQVCTDRGKK
ncbi:tetratricopeptide repeat protein [Actinoplanes siamensis]|uniref:Fibronectin type-III domain-containing protein n=1 Tax=Actinoplanes siamensis TaxID=1223317 RepID=A0A919NA86_9ACTN|nr:tetratricopeptide repeat protein [Actinoplanes siamensis]GIF07346.1 hypothetical protein Asi03nite_48840 [Actinoplanes siamensis]